MGILLLIIIFVLLLSIAFNQKRVKKKVVYLDTGRTASIFYNQEFNISAKPDKLISVKNGVDLYEYKSRKTSIYLSDEMQATAAAIAVSSQFNVNNIIIEIETGKKKTIKGGNPQILFNRISRYYNLAQAIIDGSYRDSPTPNKYKCRGCNFRKKCEYAK